MRSGLIDAVVMDEVIARYTITKRPDVFIVLGEGFGKELYGVGFRKTDIALRDAVDRVLRRNEKGWHHRPDSPKMARRENLSVKSKAEY